MPAKHIITANARAIYAIVRNRAYSNCYGLGICVCSAREYF